MKVKTVLLMMIALFLLGGMGCEKERDDLFYLQKELNVLKCPPTPKKGIKDDVIGKWKLIKKWHNKDTVDVSCDNVYYEFNKDNTLIVSGNKDDIPEGKYTYSYIIYNPCPLCDPGPNLSIEGYKPMGCIVSEYEMIINLKLFIRTK